MDKEVSRPTKLAYVGEEDIALLAADLGPGYFTAAHLYDWYSMAARQEGKEPPSKKSFGMALRAAGLQGSVRRVDGGLARCWLITRPWERRGLAILAEEKAAKG